MRGFARPLAILLLCGWAASASAFDDEVVGVLALLDEAEIAAELKLTPEVKQQLIKLMEEREAAALELSAELKQLSPPEAKAKLAPFVAESEKQGLALLAPEQRTRLQQLSLARGGLLKLTTSDAAAQLNLTDDQKSRIATIRADWEEKSRQGTARERQVVKALAERQLLELLAPAQKITWETLTGRPPGDAATVAATPASEAIAKSPEIAAAKMPDPADSKSDEESDKQNAETQPDGSTVAERTAEGEAKLKFGFRYTPWKDVLEWFARQADLSLVFDTTPPGTFNYSDQRQYSPAEAIDLLNSVLLTKGYTLVRRGRMLLVINLEDGIPPNLVPQVAPAELAAKGEYELVSCLFPLGKFAPEDAEKEIRPLMGPQGFLFVMPKAKQIYVTETAGKLRAIQMVLQQVEDPAFGMEEKIATFKLKHVLPSELMLLARPLLGMPENVNSTPDGSLRVSLDELNGRILATGRPERVQKFSDLVTTLDMEEASEVGPASTVETPQLEVYALTTANPDTVLQVLRTLLGGLADVRLDKDANTGNLVALARPSQHATIRATIDQMQKDARQVEVIRLRKLDPAMAVVAINKLFGGVEGETSTTGPRVDADPSSMQLLIRGSQSQIEQVRELLSKMGEATSEEIAAGLRSNVRMLPLTGRNAASALEQLEALWPTVRSNRIRTLTPGKESSLRVPLPPSTSREREDLSPSSQRRPANTPPHDRSVTQPRPRTHLVQFTKNENEKGPATENAAVKPPVQPATPGEKQKSVPGAEIVVTMGPGGLIIASEDLDALDQFEQMLEQISSQSAASGKEYAVFYLRYAKAEAAVEILQASLGGSSGGESEGGGGLMGDLASSFLGNQSGGLLGGLMGMGGGGSSGSSSSGPVSMTADPRINALICRGKAADLDLVEQLLKVVDQPNSPEDVQTYGKPRFIPVEFASAEDIAATVKQLYSNRMAADASQQRQPSPEEFIRALRGGGRGGSTAKKSEEQKIMIGVDRRSNALIVAAPDPLFEEIQQLVKRLDVANATSDESVKVVSVKGVNAALVEKALSTMIGENATVRRNSNGTSSTGGGDGGRSNNSSGNRTASPEQMQDEIRRRVEAFNSLQRGGGPQGFAPPGGGPQGFGPPGGRTRGN